MDKQCLNHTVFVKSFSDLWARATLMYPSLSNNGYFVGKTTNDSVTCSMLAIIHLFYYISVGILATSQMCQMNEETLP